MKYKIGDKVKIKDKQYEWMVQEEIDHNLPNLEGIIEKVFFDRFNERIVVYHLKNFEFSISESEIDYVIKEIPINNRFEILDI
jgi:hypothetical protein